MADQVWSKETFAEGYSSGRIIGLLGNGDPETEKRLLEEKKLGGSLSEFFLRGVKPLLSPNFRVLELGPGRGSWTRALVSVITRGEIHTIDLQDIRPWVKDIIANFPDRFFIHQVATRESKYDFLQDNYFDAFFTFGVFCHMNLDEIEDFLQQLRGKLRKESICIAQYSDWVKAISYCLEQDGYQYNLEAYNMLKRDYPFEVKMIQCKTFFQKLITLFEKYIQGKYPVSKVSSDRCFWVKNDQKTMNKILANAGYEVLQIDMGYFKRDSVALFKPI